MSLAIMDLTQLNDIMAAITTVTEGQFHYLRVPLSFPFVFFLLMMTAIIALLVTLVVMSWRKK